MTKFKVGDKVIFNKENEQVAKEFDYKINKPYEVQNVFSQTGTLQVINENGSTNAFYKERFELVESKPTKNQRITALEETVAKQSEELSELKLIVHELRGKKSIEPSTIVEDIIEFEGDKYKKVDREARKGDVVIFRVNDTHEIHSTTNKPYKVTEEEIGRPRFESKSCTYNVYTTDHNRTPETTDVYELIKSKPLTPNQQRAAIIEKAKKFVEVKSECLKDSPLIPGGFERKEKENPNYNSYVLKVDFFTNKEKRVITALCKSPSSGLIKTKGIAKCKPSNVFNEHIGKAIALGRALGLNVSEFEQAVKPTLAVGQIVECIEHKVYELGSFRESAIGLYGCSKAFNIEGKGTWLGDNQITKIINDTNAIYGGVGNES